MNGSRWELLGASSGFAALAVSAAAVAYERGAPPDGASGERIADFLTANRDALTAQSVLFVAGAALVLWFLASLRAFLLRSEGGAGRLSGLAYGAGVAGMTIGLVAQAFQVGLATGTSGTVAPELFATMGAVFAVANLPLAVMLAAVAVLALRTRALPAWLGMLSAAAAAAATTLGLAVAVDSGPLSAGGWLSSGLYAAFPAWLLATTIVMVRRIAGSAR